MIKNDNSLSSINLVALFVRLIYCLKTQIYGSYFILQPVHAAGRYFRNSLVEILKDDFGFQKIYSMWQLGTLKSLTRSLNLSPATNRLDRLTSGLMVIPLSAERACSVSKEFVDGKVRKEYIARCKGEFAAYVTSINLRASWMLMSFCSEEVVCEEPLLTVDRQMGLNIVHPEGKVRSRLCI